MKRFWNASAIRPQRAARHEYTRDEETGITACTGYTHWVYAPVRVIGGPSDGRVITVWLTPDEAEEQARALLEAAAEARKENERR